MISTKARHLGKEGETVVIRLTLQKKSGENFFAVNKAENVCVPSPALSERVVHIRQPFSKYMFWRVYTGTVHWEIVQHVSVLKHWWF